MGSAVNPVLTKPTKPAPDPDRWGQQVRLECLKVAAARAVTAKTVYDAGEILALARSLEKFVIGG
jgi:hypothetical protein